MNKNFLFTIAFLLTLKAIPAMAGKETGGGDACENRIQVIRDDLVQWLQREGPRNLVFQPDQSYESYSAKMIEQMAKAKIKCVAPGDKGFPIQVGATPKTCRFDRDDVSAAITCDIEKFNALNEDAQYTLVHHEYAGLSSLEVPNGDESQYFLSNQISAFLETVTVRKLSVLPSARIPQLVESKMVNFKIVHDESFICGAHGGIWLTIPNPFLTTGEEIRLKGPDLPGVRCENIRKAILNRGIKFTLTHVKKSIFQAYQGSFEDDNRDPCKITDIEAFVTSQYETVQFPRLILSKVSNNRSLPLNRCAYSFGGIIDSATGSAAQCTGYLREDQFHTPGIPYQSLTRVKCNFTGAGPSVDAESWGNRYSFTVSSGHERISCRGPRIEEIACSFGSRDDYR